MLKKLMEWILARLDEPSTWASLASVAGVVAVQLQSHAGLGAAVGAAVIGVVKSEK